MSTRSCASLYTSRLMLCQMLLGFLGLVCMPALTCRQDMENTTPDPTDNTGGKNTLYTSPAEKHLVQTTDDEGNTITLSGDRDEAGVPLKLQSAFVQTSDQLDSSEGTWLYFDDQDRPSRIQGSDGTVIELTWETDSNVVISAISPDGTVQVNTDAQLSTGSNTAKATDQAVEPGVKSEIDNQEKDASSVTQQAVDAVLVEVRVTSPCGGTPTINEVLDVNVLVSNTWYNAALQSPGRYAVTIPLASFSPPPDPAKVKQVCDGLGNILSKACKDSTYAAQLEANICSGLSAAFDASSASASAKNSVANQCHQGFKGLSTVCYMAASGITNSNPTPADASNFICSNLKDAIEVAVAPASTPTASATAYIEGTGYVSSSGTVNLSDAFVQGRPAKLNIQSPTQNPGVLSIDITPQNPGAGQGYVAKATINCAAGHSVIMGVSGSDGFSTGSILNSDQAVDTIEVTVPGGASGVKDTITLTIDDQVVRTTSLVFGG